MSDERIHGSILILNDGDREYRIIHELKSTGVWIVGEAVPRRWFQTLELALGWAFTHGWSVRFAEDGHFARVAALAKIEEGTHQ